MIDQQSHFVIPAIFVSAALTIQADGAVDYESEIQPVLEENCLKCHGPEKQKSEFRVDQRAVMLKGGDTGIPALVPSTLR